MVANETGHPSIVQWEGIQVKKKECILKGVIFALMAFILSIVIYSGFIKIYQVNLEVKYIKEPPGVNCK